MMAGERMRLAMAHLAHTATQLESDVNAGYIDYDDYDDRRGCRPVDSSDEDEADVDLTVRARTALLRPAQSLGVVHG